MLYDKRWDKKLPVTKAKPMTLPHLINWLKTKPADEAYDYCEPDNCLVAQYLRAQGYRWATCNSETYTHFSWLIPITHKLPEGFNKVAITPDFRERTFGTALKVAEELNQQA